MRPATARAERHDALDGVAREISGVLAVLCEPGQVYELRILHTRRGTVSGYFNDFDRLATAAAQWDGQAPGVYVTVNAVNAALLSRASNRVQEYAKYTTADPDIACRRWFPIDLDPVRPAGISTTEAEHDAALRHAEEVRAYLVELGFSPDSIVSADSGNGAHLLVRVALPNDAAATQLLKRCLQALDLRFSTGQIQVDQTTFNASRIWKVYGTLAAKGDASDDRPHRRARLLHVPEHVTAAPHELLERLAALVPDGHAATGNNQPGGFNLAAWLVAHPVAVVVDAPWQNGRKLILNPCPWNPEHTNRAAYIVQFPNGAVAAGCHHNGCAGKGWRELRALYESEADQTKNDDGPRGLSVVNIAEFLTLSFPPRECLLDPPIPRQGIVMVHAWRGVGKTYFALSVAAAVATAKQYLRWHAPAARRVLYVDGEMPAPVMQERLARIFADGAAPPDPDYLRLVTPDLQAGSMPDLSTKRGQTALEPLLTGVDLVVVDNISTLCRSGVENDAESWLTVQDWALSLRRRGLSVLFVHHDSKEFRQRGTSRREDTLDTVIALRQPADYHASDGARFEVHFEKNRGFRGKDAEPFEASLTEDAGHLAWTVKSIEDRTTERVAELLDEGMSQRDIAKQLGVGVATVSRHTKKARAKGLVDG